MIFRGLSYRHRVPLQVSVVVLVTGLLFALVLGWKSYDTTRRALTGEAQLLVAIYAHGLLDSLKHHDIWQAYTLIRKKPQDPAYLAPLARETVVVLDRNGRVFASSDPKRYPVGRPQPALLSGMREADGARGVLVPRENLELVGRAAKEDDSILGWVVLLLPRKRYLEGVYPVVGQITLVTLLLFLVLVPLGWLAGLRLSNPIASLHACLHRLEREGPAAARCALHEGPGEFGEVGRKLRQVLEQLAEKQELEQQMIAEERLAAIGRLAATVAHEVNNPLSGMLTALDTFKRHGDDPRVARETVALLERGLEQIRHTVSALLLQSRRQDRPFNARDAEDIRILLEGDLQKKGLRLAWENHLVGTLELPSAGLRQILLNLMLNAIEATPEGGQMRVVLRTLEKKGLEIEVSNEGREIPPEQQEALFEPFAGSGTGLGLWVTRQLVQQLRGDLSVVSERGWNRFTVNLPLDGERDE